MAIVALGFLMRSQSWEFSQVVIEKYRVLPLYFRVTKFALVTQRPFMYFVLEMARSTGLFQCNLKYRLDMTVHAGRGLVCAAQFVVRIPVVIKLRFSPVETVMASIAGIAVTPRVFIVLEVTRHAGHIHLILKWILRVTVSTG